ncbi:putative malate dehydrogenase 1B isoform X1 [Lytechinus variegatus]|uniref:putative malate dehydrogenase 1B isoform X1 n=2 Tax=Lytechinus variegatus TaxID=7654 RepID=UPI001BB229B1|nr:putative malate dehydrogenase 1B isoform X1 [Lytechinus variegatus]
MAKFVIAGRANCPYYAKVELLADELKATLQDFSVHKIVKQPAEWEDWLQQQCKQNNWSFKKSPIVWRELIERGGKGVLIGGSNEFQEYAYSYYGVSSEQMSIDMTKIASENLETKVVVDAEEQHRLSLSKPLQVCITNSSSPIAYHMVNEIARGDVLGHDKEVSIRLLTKPADKDFVEGQCMEAFDLACPLLRNVKVHTDATVALTGVHVAVFLDEFCLTEEESAKLGGVSQEGCAQFAQYGRILNQYADQDVKVLISGKGKLNFSALMLKHSAPRIARQNIIITPRLQENRAKAAIARKINVNSASVADLIIWGNIGGITHNDISEARVFKYEGAVWGPPSFSRPVTEVVHDEKWLQTEYPQLLQNHPNALETMLNHKVAMSEAHAVTSVLNHWFNGSPDKEVFSLGVYSDGWYELPVDIFFSLPVKFQKGAWEVVQDRQITPEVRVQLDQITNELIHERYIIFPPPKADTPPPESSIEGEPTPVEDAGMVFGEGEKEKGKEGSSSGTEGETSSSQESRSGNLSRIAEESESDAIKGRPESKSEGEKSKPATPQAAEPV